ncbi:hypothetical protein Egran_00134 [Elaphomyces granulatus]|uniref:Extracellular membrane protein CFEM domain-containing protein n=1 Tax=Elaphomyces granulatus TaxID=519963 RepID=A0A232M6W3_9EURO|nr:hypothetical protein Egran_00134 [Elaphomyces granulatus]
MRFIAPVATVLMAAVGFAAAQTATHSASSSSSTSSCQAQPILDACLQRETPQFQACTANDWSCLCTQSTNVLTCYNNCPNDPGKAAAQSVVTANCNAASAYVTTSAPAATKSGSTSAISAASVSAASGSSGSTATAPSGSGTASTKASSTAGAVARAVETGGMVAAMMIGLVAAL